MCKMCELYVDDSIIQHSMFIDKHDPFVMSRVGDDYYIGVYQDHPILKEQKLKINFCPFCGRYLGKIE